MTKKSTADNTLETLNEINEKLEKRVSLLENFKVGIVRGLGTAIGATIVAGIALALLSRVIDQVEDVPIIDDFVERTNLEESIDSQ